MTDKQPVALALAAFLEQFRSFPDALAAAAELRRLHAELVESDALRLENAALRADAERYRWLRDNAGVGQGEHVHEQMAYQFEVLTGVSHVSHIYHHAELPSIDAAIDAARCKT